MEVIYLLAAVVSRWFCGKCELSWRGAILPGSGRIDPLRDARALLPVPTRSISSSGGGEASWKHVWRSSTCTGVIAE